MFQSSLPSVVFFRPEEEAVRLHGGMLLLLSEILGQTAGRKRMQLLMVMMIALVMIVTIVMMMMMMMMTMTTATTTTIMICQV